MSGNGTGPDGKDPPPLAAEVAPAVAELAAEGFGRNAISRALAVSPTTVTRAARIAGVEFDPAATEVATRSRAEQFAEDRAALAAQAAEIGRRAGRRLFVELGAELLDPAAIGALNKAWGTSADKLLAASATVQDEARDEHAAARAWLEGVQLQIAAAGRGLIQPGADGNFHFAQPSMTDHLDHDDLDLMEDTE